MSPRRRERWILAASLALAPALLAPEAQAACSKPVFKDPSMVIDCPAAGMQQSFVVPRGVGKVRVIAIGAGGGNGSDSVVCIGPGFFPTPPCPSYGPGGHGGLGTIASADLRVKPGRRLYVNVGGRGGSQMGSLAGAGGFNGGASGGALTLGRAFSNYLSGAGGGGGGASDVRTCSSYSHKCDSLASRLLVAAGGGGGGGDVSSTVSEPGAGGSGGGVRGESADGSSPDGGAGGPGGGGGTATAGGAPGGPYAAAGTAGAGGRGTEVNDIAGAGGGGGGGGGRFGGGGGSAGIDNITAGAGGGGGSSFGPRGTRFASAARLEDGAVRIFYLATRIARRR